MTADPVAALLARDGALRRIFLRDHAVWVRMGVHASEQSGPQRILVNVDLYLRDGPAPTKDNIAEVIDYDFLRTEIMALATRQHFNLQETFVHAILAICLARPGVAAARVSSAKPDVYPDCKSVGYEATQLAER
jgi:7,8-dihydroneopterin aldolase/epimerase/oxygenase